MPVPREPCRWARQWHKVDFDARLAIAEEHAKATHLAVIDALHSVYAVQRLHRLRCNGDCIVGQQIGGVLHGDDSAAVNFRSYCELCWPRPHSTCQTVAAAGAVPRPDPQGRCVNVSLLFQHGESAEDTVFTERAVCFRRQHCPIGLPIHAMHRHSGPRRPGMTGHPSAPQLRQPAAEPHGATPGGPRPPQHSVAPANTDHGFSVITVPSARPLRAEKEKPPAAPVYAVWLSGQPRTPPPRPSGSRLAERIVNFRNRIGNIP